EHGSGDSACVRKRRFARTPTQVFDGGHVVTRDRFQDFVGGDDTGSKLGNSEARKLDIEAPGVEQLAALEGNGAVDRALDETNWQVTERSDPVDRPHREPGTLATRDVRDKYAAFRHVERLDARHNAGTQATGEPLGQVEFEGV